MIFGSTGMLGSALCRVLPDAICFTHKDIDITNRQCVIDAIKENNPDIVINAAVYTEVDKAEDEKELAFTINGYAPGYIAEACSMVDAKLIHYSTDYVFDGTKQEYMESDKTNPINTYGRSKLLGEQEITKHTHNYIIIRTSWLFGMNGKNFIDTMLRISLQMKTVNVVNDQFGKPTYTVDLAKKNIDLLESGSGIYHLTNDGTCSWYEFASASINNTTPCSTEDCPTRAKRPKYSILTNTKITPMRHWKEALAEYMQLKNDKK